MSNTNEVVCIFGPNLRTGFYEQPAYSLSSYAYFLPLLFGFILLGKTIESKRSDGTTKISLAYWQVFAILIFIILADFSIVINDSVFACKMFSG